MTNINRVCGLKPLYLKSGAPWSGAVNHYAVPASDGTALFVGDVVKGVVGMTDMGAGYAGAARYFPTVIQAGQTDTPTGIVVGFMPLPTALDFTYRKASTLREVLVLDSEDIVFEIQSDGTGAAADVGKFADIAVGAGGTVFGTSGMYLLHSSIGSGVTVRIDGISYTSNSNELGAYTTFICSFIKHRKSIAAVATALS